MTSYEDIAKFYYDCYLTKSRVALINKEVTIQIVDLYYDDVESIVVKFIYNDVVYNFRVFNNNNYSSADNKFSFKILDENNQLKVPNYRLLVKFNLTKLNDLKCLSARIKE